MTTSALLLQDFDIEISNIRRTLERVPEGSKEFKCHEKSRPLGKLAMHCATLPMFGYYLLEEVGMDMAKPTRTHVPLVFTTREACLKQLDETASKCRSALAGTTDEQFAIPWRFTFGKHLISEASRSLTFRAVCSNHLVHHTAQLGVSLRLNDIPVPALYGPSADEQWTSPRK